MKKENKLSYYKRIFIDTNIFIGYMATSEAFERDKILLSQIFKMKDIEFFVSSLTIAQIAARYQKQDYKKARTLIDRILDKCTVLSVGGNTIKKALLCKSKDIEDNIQYMVSLSAQCTLILTNNLKDYSNFIKVKKLSSKNFIQEAV